MNQTKLLYLHQKLKPLFSFDNYLPFLPGKLFVESKFFKAFFLFHFLEVFIITLHSCSLKVVILLIILSHQSHYLVLIHFS